MLPASCRQIALARIVSLCRPRCRQHRLMRPRRRSIRQDRTCVRIGLATHQAAQLTKRDQAHEILTKVCHRVPQRDLPAPTAVRVFAGRILKKHPLPKGGNVGFIERYEDRSRCANVFPIPGSPRSTRHGLAIRPSKPTTSVLGQNRRSEPLAGGRRNPSES